MFTLASTYHQRQPIPAADRRNAANPLRRRRTALVANRVLLTDWSQLTVLCDLQQRSGICTNHYPQLHIDRYVGQRNRTVAQGGQVRGRVGRLFFLSIVAVQTLGAQEIVMLDTQERKANVGFHQLGVVDGNVCPIPDRARLRERVRWSNRDSRQSTIGAVAIETISVVDHHVAIETSIAPPDGKKL